MKEFIKTNKVLVSIAGAAGVILIVILVFVLMRSNQPTVPFTSQTNGNAHIQSNSNATSSTGSKKSNQGVNLFSWLFPSHNNSGQSSQIPTSPTATAVNQTQTQAPGQNTVTTQGVDNTTNGSTNTGSKTTTSNSTNSTNSINSSNNSTASNPNATNFQIVFNGSGAYIPPAVPPVQITWNTYIDNTYHYSIQYPDGWQAVNGLTPFAKGTVLFLPGENTTDPSQKYVSFGWSNYNIYPTDSINNGGSVASPAKVTGVDGTIYTRGPIGQSYIVSVFPYRQGYFGLITYSSDPTITYVYQHMLESLVFNR